MNKVKCPYCESLEKGPDKAFDGEESERECSQCAREFRIIVKVKHTYFTAKSFCEQNNENHKFKPHQKGTKEDGEVWFSYICKACGRLEYDTNEKPKKRIRSQVVEG